MTILDRLFSRMGYTRKTATISNPPAWLLADADYEQYNVPSGQVFANQAQLMQRLSWVNIAIGTIARAAAVLDLNVLRMVGEETEDIPNHDFERLLWKPNPLQSRSEFLEASFSWRLLTGNCYWWLNRRGEDDQPAELWVIPSNKIAPVPDDKMYIKGYVYSPDGVYNIPLEPWEVVHFKTFHPLNPWVGLSPIEALAVISESDLNMQKWNLQLFGENAARLPGILAFASNINDSEWRKMKEDINDKASKRQIMMLRNVSSGGVNWIQASATQRDMEFLASRQATKEEIFNAFAPGLVGMLDKNATEANAKSAKATFAEYGLWPMLDATAQKITNDILPAYGDELRAEFDDPRVSDRAMELSEQQAAEKVMTIDELREAYYSLPPIAEVSEQPDDKRGVMLVAQINSSTPIGEPEPEPILPEAPVPPIVEMPDMTENEPEAEQEQETEEEAAMRADLERWKRKSLNAVKRGKAAAVDFESVSIPPEFREQITAGLAGAVTADDVRGVFGAITETAAPEFTDPLVALVNELKRANDLLEKHVTD